MDEAPSLNDEEEKEALAAAADAIEAADRQLLLCAKRSCGEFMSPSPANAVLCCGMVVPCIAVNTMDMDVFFRWIVMELSRWFSMEAISSAQFMCPSFSSLGLYKLWVT